MLGECQIAKHSRVSWVNCTATNVQEKHRENLLLVDTTNAISKKIIRDSHSLDSSYRLLFFCYDMIAKEVLKILIMCRKNSWSNLGGHYSGFEIGVMEIWGTNPRQAFLIRKQKFTWKIAGMEWAVILKTSHRACSFFKAQDVIPGHALSCVLLPCILPFETKY